MKQPAFRLEPVLELRRSQERAASLAAAQAAREAAEAAQRAEDGAAALAASTPPSGVSATAFVAAMVASRTAAADVQAARALAVSYAEQAELVRAQWTAAAQRTKGLERLRERHLQAVRLAEQAAEERTVDDLVTGRSGRRTRTDGEAAWTD